MAVDANLKRVAGQKLVQNQVFGAEKEGYAKIPFGLTLIS
jgi:hypothetical protein